jgi:ectoine hydroxylase-related dioxygenase (phytanoyl-CoA dioxygenase family)
VVIGGGRGGDGCRTVSGVIQRVLKNLAVLDPDRAPAESAQLERDGYVHLRAVFDADAVATMRRETEAVYDAYPAERVRGDKAEFRYEMFNRSAACQAAIAHPAILRVVEPLLGEDCHVIANTAWRNPPDFPGGPWHCDAGPHVPRPADVPWDDRIPYPVFAVAGHIYLQDCRTADGPTAVVPGSHRSGRLPPYDRIATEEPTYEPTYDGRPPAAPETDAGDVLLFVSDAWHRGVPAGPGGRGRFFLQVHYARRDIAQRVKLTEEVNHATPEAVARTTTDRERTVIGLHAPFFYDA